MTTFLLQSTERKPERKLPLGSKITVHIPHTFMHSRITQIDTRHSIKTTCRKAPSTSCAMNGLSSLQLGKRKHTEWESGEQKKCISFSMYLRQLFKKKFPGNSEKGGQVSCFCSALPHILVRKEVFCKGAHILFLSSIKG